MIGTDREHKMKHFDIHFTKYFETSVHWTNDTALYFYPSSANEKGYHAYFIRLGKLYFIHTFWL